MKKVNGIALLWAAVTHLPAWLALGGTALMLASCFEDPVAGDGGGTQTGNPSIAGRALDSLGNPIVQAVVFLRPDTFMTPVENASTGDLSTLTPDAVTDSTGYFELDSVPAGNYRLETNNLSGLAKLIPVNLATDTSTVDLQNLTLQTTGEIKGVLPKYMRKAGYRLRVRGLERLARADSATGKFSLANLPEGVFDCQLATVDTHYAPIEIPDVPIQSGETWQVPLYGDWQYGGSLQLNTGALTAPLTDFPLLLRLRAGNFNFSQAKPEGEDLRILNADSTPAAFEIENWDTATAQADIWILADTLYPSTSHTWLALWGNPNAPTLSSPESVFSSDGYHAVWHQYQSGGTDMNDATGNRFTGIPTGMDGSSDVTGMVGRAQRFDAVDQNITVQNSSSSVLNLEPFGNYTLSLWTRPEALNGSIQTLVYKGIQEYLLQINANDEWEFVAFHGGGNADTVRAAAAGGVWSHLAVVRNGASLELYVNGALENSLVSTDTQVTPPETTINLMLGNSDAGDVFTGLLDEVRIAPHSFTQGNISLSYQLERENATILQFTNNN